MTSPQLNTNATHLDKQVSDLPTLCVQAHAANLMVLHDKTLACVWFGGSMEGKSDISVFISKWDPQSLVWSKPEQLSNDPTRSEQNPILFAAPNQQLWLMHTAQQSGNQDTAIVRRRVSMDHGKTWGPSETMDDFRPGTFIRQPIHVHQDGAWLLPTFDCRVRAGEKWDGSFDVSAVMRSVDQGKHWSRIDVPQSMGCVHMSIVPAKDGKLLGFFRSRWADHVYTSQSDDAGLTWSTPTPTVLPNNNSSIQALRLKDGRLAMIFNHSSSLDATERRASLYDELEEQAPLEPQTPTASKPLDERRAFWGAPRAPLTLALSEDDGLTWPWMRDLEVGDGYCMSNDSAKQINREYSYPSLRQTDDGALHLAYTVFRQHIRHVRLMPEWIMGSARDQGV